MQLSQKSLKKLRTILLEITPEITDVLDEIAKINKMRLDNEGTSKEDAFNKGIDVTKELIDMLLVRKYDSIIKIIAALYETKPSRLEEKTVGEITDMIFDTLSDESLMRFFPRSRPLARRTPAAILQK